VADTYTHPDTGETFEIPEGANVTTNDDGEITGWSNPPETPEDELHPDQVEGYEPKFARESMQRRALGHVTDDDHLGRGPRNNAARLQQELVEDGNSPFDDDDDVQELLDDLEASGLVTRSDDGIYSVTDAGRVELAN
jgi:hypothetical protein